MKFGHKKDVTKIFLIGFIFIFCWVALGFSPKNIFYSLHPEVVLPQWYIENHQWNVEIISAPECPKVETLRLVKTSPFNFELRNGFIYGHSFTKVLQFSPGTSGKKEII